MPKGTRTKNRADPPDARQVLRLLAGQPTDMEAQLNGFPRSPPKTMVRVAALLGCSVYRVRKTIAAI
jgi:hypothetical protein